MSVFRDAELQGSAVAIVVLEMDWLMVLPTMNSPSSCRQICPRCYAVRQLKTMNKSSRFSSTVGASPVKDADEPPSIGLPASPKPL